MTTTVSFWQFLNSAASYKRWLKWLFGTYAAFIMLWLIDANVDAIQLPGYFFPVLPLVFAAAFFVIDGWRHYNQQKTVKNQ